LAEKVKKSISWQWAGGRKTLGLWEQKEEEKIKDKFQKTNNE
jgi:hypothetical protein